MTILCGAGHCNNRSIVPLQSSRTSIHRRIIARKRRPLFCCQTQTMTSPARNGLMVSPVQPWTLDVMGPASRYRHVRLDLGISV
jgi:hypothetical protein